ncbi:hypothetical protein, partial [Paraburkholderia nemoris]|uniref:hypothetical protein n=1 Tax=Paraburkholderia nemoris TaxID=2793076 RepID=UPI001F2CDCB4
WLTGSVNLNALIMLWKSQHRETVGPSRLLAGQRCPIFSRLAEVSVLFNSRFAGHRHSSRSDGAVRSNLFGRRKIV